MPLAFVLISVETGGEDEVIEALRRIKQVSKVYRVYGIYDIIVRLETRNMDELNKIVWWNIRRLDKVRSTVTMIVQR
ncbi:TPA: Lrp/AsnC family transcriptional regulator [Candidatus Bathyarchaeota archaeon]|nr:Lrp/AsnC family transcriptional regulator [Candidatus Bathyarchaeota archaeon]